MHHRIRRSFSRIYTSLRPNARKTTMKASIPLVNLTLLSLSAVRQSSASDKLHEKLTAAEIRQLFNVEPHEVSNSSEVFSEIRRRYYFYYYGEGDGLSPALKTTDELVPDYDVVPIQWPKIHKRAHGRNTRMHIDAFGRDIKLWLNPVEGVLFARNTPVYVTESANDPNSTASFVEIPDAMAKIGTLFEDRDKQTSLLVKRSASGVNLISGHIGSEGWTLKPVPERIRRRLNAESRRSIDELKDITSGDLVAEHYVIYKNPKLSEEVDHISQPLQDDILNNKAIRSKRKAPSVIYPQIMVMADYETFKRHNENIDDLLEYMVPFWNGVDLRYRSLEHPKVRLNIAGIIVAKDSNAFPFVTKNKVGTNMMEIFGAIKGLSHYMPTIKKQFPFDSYDVALLMAPYSMCSKNQIGLCLPGYLGLAFISGACNVSDTGVPANRGVAVFTDKGGYDGMHTAAHEMGHLFGATHDGELGSFCSPNVGNIMSSSPVLTEHTADWSPCTVAAFNMFFNYKDPKCLFNKPNTTSPLPRELPGKFMSADEQCAKLAGTRTCTREDNICIRLKCRLKGMEEYCIDVGNAAADGTTCGEDKICVHGQCVAEKDTV